MVSRNIYISIIWTKEVSIGFCVQILFMIWEQFFMQYFLSTREKKGVTKMSRRFVYNL